MDPKVSIVIPVYNGSNYLAEAIESALAQTYRNLEVLVVNDGSTDDGATRRVAQRYAGRIRYFEKPNGGVASALNYGIAEMAGEYFSWLSHDDLYLPQKIASQLSCLTASTRADGRAVIVYGDCAVFSRDPAQAQTVPAPDADRKYFRYLLATSSAVHGCTLLIPRAAFSEQRFDEAKPTTQDYDLWFRLAGTCDFVKQDQALVLARQHPEQDSVKKRRKARAEKNVLYRGFLAALGPADVNPATRLSPARAYLRLAASYAKYGLADAAWAAARKSMACVNFRQAKELLTVPAGLALICVLGIPSGLVRSRVADAVRGARAAS